MKNFQYVCVAQATGAASRNARVRRMRPCVKKEAFGLRATVHPGRPCAFATGLTLLRIAAETVPRADCLAEHIRCIAAKRKIITRKAKYLAQHRA